MSYSIIAAVGKNNELGKKGGLCFNLPGDLKYFRKVTRGHKVFMGSRTFFSLPKMLPGRKHLVICSKDQMSEFPEKVELFSTLTDVLKKYPEKDDSEEIFVIGGGMVYGEMIKHSKKLYLTEVNKSDKEADTFFKEFDKSEFKREVVGEGEDNGIKYKFVVYTRKEEL